MSIEAMKQALELLRKKEWEACDYTSNANKAAELLEQAIATEESSATQEPVRGTYWACEKCDFACDKDDCCPECGHHTLVQQDFHTQPKREWVGLTDEERVTVQYEAYKKGLSPLEFMEEHEAKLKEKNT